jgi:uncharacterized protein
MGTIMEVVVNAVVDAVLAASRLAAIVAVRAASGRFSFGAAVLVAAVLAAMVFVTILPAPAQPSHVPPERRVVVIGEGSVRVPPDYAHLRSGVTTTAKTAKDATDANSKLMTAVTAALTSSGIEQKDIQTTRFSLQPVYAPRQPNAEPRLTGFTVSNQVNVTIRQIDKVGEILDRLVTAGATDVGNVEFLHAEPAKALDQAREAAVADARRKAELYAHAVGLSLGDVIWITEDSGYLPPGPMAGLRASGGMAAAVPIAAGENALDVRVTVGFDMVH